MKYESWISYRYLTSKKGNFLSFLHIVSIVGVAIGVAALIVVTAVMTGFGNNLREKIIGTTPHLMIEKENGIVDYKPIIDQISQHRDVIAASAYIQGNIFLEDRGRALPLSIRGVVSETEEKITKVKEYLKKGDIAGIDQGGILIGKELARYFGYEVGDEVTLISPGSGLAGEGWRYTLPISGIFESGMADYDMNLVVVSLAKAQEIFRYPENVVSGIGIKINDPYRANEIKEDLYKTITYRYLIRSWIDLNRNLFEALFLEKWGLFIVLSLMVLVASFNIISTLIVTVTSKIHDIGILQSIGVPRSSIRKIFTRQGVYIGLYGILWGMIFGIGICHILGTYVKVPQDIYSIDRVPVDLQAFDLIAIVCSAYIITFLATVYPAAKAASLQPVDALRYE